MTGVADRAWPARGITSDDGTASCRFAAARLGFRSCPRGTTTSRSSKGWRRSPAPRFRSPFQRPSEDRSGDEPHRPQQRAFDGRSPAICTRTSSRVPRARRFADRSNGCSASSHDRSLTVIDFSHVSMIDFSCADEVVAKLLIRYVSDERAAGRVLRLPRRHRRSPRRDRDGARAARTGAGARTGGWRSKSWACSPTPNGRCGTRRIAWDARPRRTSRTRSTPIRNSTLSALDGALPAAADDAYRRRVRRRRHRPWIRIRSTGRCALRRLSRRAPATKNAVRSSPCIRTTRSRVCSPTVNWRGCTARAAMSWRRSRLTTVCGSAM